MGYFDDIPVAQSSPKKGYFDDIPDVSQSQPIATGKIAQQVLELPKAGIESALPLVTGLVPWAAGSVAGAAGSIVGGPEKMKEWEEATTNALTYEPRTAGGKAGAEALNKPLEYVQKPLDAIERYTTEKTGSPELGWSAKKAAEALMFKGMGKAGEVVSPLIKEQLGLDPMSYKKGDIVRDAKLADEQIAQVAQQEGKEFIQQTKVLGAEPPIKMWEPWKQPEPGMPTSKPTVTPTQAQVPRFFDDIPDVPTQAEPIRSVTPNIQEPTQFFNMEEARRINQERVGKNVAIPETTLAARNNNPGNLRFVGQEGAVPGEKGFAKFETPEAGYEALQRQIELDKGRGHTVESFVNKYAPPTENNTAQYAKIVAEKAGVSLDTPLKDVSTDLLAKEIARIESGTKVRLSKEDAEFVRANDTQPAKLIEDSAPIAREIGVDAAQYVENRLENLLAEHGVDYLKLSEMAEKVVEPPIDTPTVQAVEAIKPKEELPVKVLTPGQTKLLTERVYKNPGNIEATLRGLRERGYQLPPGKITGQGKRFKLTFTSEVPVEVPKAASAPRASFLSQDVLDWLKDESGALHVGNITNDLKLLKQKLNRVPDSELVVPPGARLQFADPLVEANYKVLGRMPQKDLLQSIGENVAGILRDFREHHKYLDPKNPPEARAAEAFRQLDSAYSYGSTLSYRFLKKTVGDLAPNEYDIFERRVVLPDIVRQAESGELKIKPGEPLHYGFKDVDAVKSEVANLDNILASNPKIAQSVAARERFMGDLLNSAVDAGVLPEELRNTKDYFHRETAKYVQMDRYADPTKKRTGTVAEFYHDYVEAEHKVISSLLYKIEQKKLYSKLGEENVRPRLVAEYGEKWREHIPEGYVEYDPTLDIRSANITDNVVQVLVDDTLKEAGVNWFKDTWVMPENIVKELKWRAMRSPEASRLNKISKMLMDKWKQNALYNPLHFAKYTLNNMSGDVDAAFAYRPEIVTKYAKQSGKDVADWMKQKRPELNEEFNRALREGVINSGQTYIEIPEAAVQMGLDAITGRDIGSFRKMVRGYLNFAEGINTWRENTLRLAAYRYFKDQIAQGNKQYGASRAYELDALHVEDRAAKLSRDLLGDYGNVSLTGQWIREKLVPFWSWIEINTPRYFRMVNNLRKEGGTLDGVAVVGGKKIAMNYLKFAIAANALSGVVQLYNQTMYPELADTFNSESERGQQHIILGVREDGSPISLRFQGALSDVASWVGMPNYLNDLQQLITGDASLFDLAEKAPKAFFTKLWQAGNPIGKATYENVSGKSMYPDPFHPRPLRDRLEHAASVVGMQVPYRMAAGLPSRGGGEVAMNITGLYSTDVGENAYYQARNLVQKYAEENKLSIPKGGEPDDKGNALYYFKRAMAYGDRDTAKKYLKKYVEAGGTNEGFKKSIAKAHPLGAIKQELYVPFIKSLTPEEKKIVRDGLRWYERIYKGKQNGK